VWIGRGGSKGKSVYPPRTRIQKNLVKGILREGRTGAVWEGAKGESGGICAFRKGVLDGEKGRKIDPKKGEGGKKIDISDGGGSTGKRIKRGASLRHSAAKKVELLKGG